MTTKQFALYFVCASSLLVAGYYFPHGKLNEPVGVSHQDAMNQTAREAEQSPVVEDGDFDPGLASGYTRDPLEVGKWFDTGVSADHSRAPSDGPPDALAVLALDAAIHERHRGEKIPVCDWDSRIGVSLTWEFSRFK